MHLAEKLSTMIKYDTTSHAGIDEHEKFLGFHKVLEELFRLYIKILKRLKLMEICFITGKVKPIRIQFFL